MSRPDIDRGAVMRAAWASAKADASRPFGEHLTEAWEVARQVTQKGEQTPHVQAEALTGEVYGPPRPMTVEEYFLWLMELRERARAMLVEVERDLLVVVDKLDMEDGDADFEPDDERDDGGDRERDIGDEPQMDTIDAGRDGYLAVMPDLEPSLGSVGNFNQRASQEDWAFGPGGGSRTGRGDCEEEAVNEDGNDEQREGDGAFGEALTVDDELDGDGEPSLGATHDIDQDLAWSDRTSAARPAGRGDGGRLRQDRACARQRRARHADGAEKL